MSGLCGVPGRPALAGRLRLLTLWRRLGRGSSRAASGVCASCRRETSVTAGTIFAGTRQPLETWFAACWNVTNQKLGVSALGLQRVLGLGSYETAWAMLHKLRRAMVRPGRERLGARSRSTRATWAASRPANAGVERARRRSPRSPPRSTASASAASGSPASRASRPPAWRRSSSKRSSRQRSSYRRLRRLRGVGDLGYTHYPTAISSTGDPAHVVMPRVHWSPRCSSGGSSAPTRAPSVRSISITTCRVHLPLQPPHLEPSRLALLPAHHAGRPHSPRRYGPAVPRHRPRPTVSAQGQTQPVGVG